MRVFKVFYKYLIKKRYTLDRQLRVNKDNPIHKIFHIHPREKGNPFVITTITLVNYCAKIIPMMLPYSSTFPLEVLQGEILVLQCLAFSKQNLIWQLGFLHCPVVCITLNSMPSMMIIAVSYSLTSFFCQLIWCTPQSLINFIHQCLSIQ